MTWTEILKTYGPGGVAIILVAWVVRFMLTAAKQVFGELVTSIRELRVTVDNHTAKDLEYHVESREAILRVEAKVDARDARDISSGVPDGDQDDVETAPETPSRRRRTPTKPQEWPVVQGGYSHVRKRKGK